jgi:hypothetical protein
VKEVLARAAMALALALLGGSRREWGLAMQAEFDAAAADDRALPFALGCLIAAGRELPASDEGRFLLTSHALALGIIVPMAALQIGCAFLDFPYLYPGRSGLAGALLEGAAHEHLMRSIYQGAVPVLALLLLALGLGHLRIAWSMLERDWAAVARLGTLMLAISATLLIFMNVLFLDSSRALLQTAALVLELASLALVARWHAQLFPPETAELSG